jgi:para-nitrobenzyl esterase
MHGPVQNDWYLGDPYKVGFSENAKRIPTMVGAVIAERGFAPMGIPKKNELSANTRRELIAQKFGSATDELIQLFKKAYPDKNELDLLVIHDNTRQYALKYLEQKSAVSEASVYSYMFSLEFNYDDGKPAWHCSDIPFAFHNTDKVAICNITGATEILEEQISGAFVNFARTGNPNHSALPQWPAFRPDNKATMVFDIECEVRVDYEKDLLNLLKKFPPIYSFNM